MLTLYTVPDERNHASPRRTKPGALVVLQDVHVAEICIRCFVCDDTGEANLPLRLEQTEAKGTLDRLRDDLFRYPLRPVRTRQIGMHGLNVQPSRVGGNTKIPAFSFEVDHFLPS